MVSKSAPDAKEVLRRLAQVFREPGAMELDDPYVTLVGVVLSARTRDEQVLLAMPAFVSRFPRVEDLAEGSVEEIREYIATIGMNGQKAKHLKGLAEKIVRDFGGEVPNSMEDLVSLPGVGRKTASVVLSVVFDTPAIAVDVHAHRVARRLRWSRAALPAGTEKDLLARIPSEFQNTVNRVFVKLGRYICLPRNPRCAMCPLQDICPYTKKTTTLKSDKELLEADWRRREENLQVLRDSVLRAHKSASKLEV